ncbi:helix-turn-helix domain-containing protein [Flavobacterium phragmitis]|uniref:Regulatory protein, luxR family n=1 Tax=Flavobacterium phragmitis TaxID=739143 RepID=A0A1I1U4I2_9FLAO|nr:helix-turn-helix transcriptional regulator [Flavobacterium phragmitis]SFD65605.1 regulatory protein, luxR family [Flavobacterium phragmitis]
MSQNLHKSSKFSVEYIASLGILKGDFHVCNSSDDFSNALKNFQRIYEQVSPEYTLWDCSNFNHIISPNEQLWIDRFMNMPATKGGKEKRKVAKLISVDLAAMHSIAEVFENGNAPVNCGYFAYEQQAVNWLLQKETKSSTTISLNRPPIFTLLKDAKSGSTSIQLQFNDDEIDFYLKQIKQLLNNRNFLLNHYHLFSLLTSQEKIILEKIIDGHESRQIADLLFVTVETIKTHRKRIFQKLKVKKFVELLPYKLFL